MTDRSQAAPATIGHPAMKRLSRIARSWPGSISALLGLVAALGFPPVHAWWIALPALALWVLHIHASPNWRGALWRGWMFGWAHLTLANNWIATAFTYQAKMPEILGWAAVPLLCVYLAVYPAMAALLAHLAARRSGQLAFAAVLAAGWIATEWIRSWAFTGYPWPPLGLVLLGSWDTPGIARLLPVMGTYALSGLAVFLAGILAVMLVRGAWLRFAAVATGIAVAMLLPDLTPGASRSTDLRFTLVQP
ncbi:MAG: apolipoprotein N-acyltransferase, partial [Erythrobacter sp.]|nr:apolipoprotein N-acyltransferase [Erythrobacter sp.]